MVLYVKRWYFTKPEWMLWRLIESVVMRTGWGRTRYSGESATTIFNVASLAMEFTAVAGVSSFYNFTIYKDYGAVFTMTMLGEELKCGYDYYYEYAGWNGKQPFPRGVVSPSTDHQAYTCEFYGTDTSIKPPNSIDTIVPTQLSGLI